MEHYPISVYTAESLNQQLSVTLKTRKGGGGVTSRAPIVVIYSTGNKSLVALSYFLINMIKRRSLIYTGVGWLREWV